ncbi:hypothetical protein FA13DRAFT_707285 [Coprinellus micaceus]|uniref:Uncharacterized protein n=1 Tax=Coprinellus micaceus TaxID=71717 RepID=A0A4Y7TUD3_COPMI|nr:hypothetical protein FA13DRAFT_707285 [Coprinellus micaceus]
MNLSEDRRTSLDYLPLPRQLSPDIAGCRRTWGLQAYYWATAGSGVAWIKEVCTWTLLQPSQECNLYPELLLRGVDIRGLYIPGHLKSGKVCQISSRAFGWRTTAISMFGLCKQCTTDQQYNPQYKSTANHPFPRERQEGNILFLHAFELRKSGKKGATCGSRTRSHPNDLVKPPSPSVTMAGVLARGSGEYMPPSSNLLLPFHGWA